MPAPRLALVATCVLGLEEFVDAELAALGVAGRERQRGAVTFAGTWEDCWRANWRLRTANRVLVELGRFTAVDGPGLAAGARALIKRPGGSGGIDPGALLHPDRSFALHATVADAAIRDSRWAALSVKDGLVDGQRERYGRRADVDRHDPDLHLRLRLHGTEATLLLDTSGEPLDHRGYREVSAAAPVREQLAAACVLASGWAGSGPVVDPLCGSGTLLVEAAWIASAGRPGRSASAGPSSASPPSTPPPGSACATSPCRRRGRGSASTATTWRPWPSRRRAPISNAPASPAGRPSSGEISVSWRHRPRGRG